MRMIAVLLAVGILGCGGGQDGSKSEIPSQSSETTSSEETQRGREESSNQAQRRAIFAELLQLEDAVSRSASRKYPTEGLAGDALVAQMGRQMDMEQRLIKEARSQLSTKYGLSVKEIDRIAFDGASSGW